MLIIAKPRIRDTIPLALFCRVTCSIAAKNRDRACKTALIPKVYNMSPVKKWEQGMKSSEVHRLHVKCPIKLILELRFDEKVYTNHCKVYQDFLER